MLTDESVLLDLKHLLMEAKQKVPQFLATMQADSEIYLDVGGQCVCVYVFACVFMYGVCMCLYIHTCVVCVWCVCVWCVCVCVCVCVCGLCAHVVCVSVHVTLMPSVGWK